MLDYLFYFFAGAFLANSIPHITNGISGRAFPTPFATPRGQSESSASLNVLWGAFNFGVGYALLFFAGSFSFSALTHAAVAGLGALLMALFLAWRFGPLYGGNRPGSGSGK